MPKIFKLKYPIEDCCEDGSCGANNCTSIAKRALRSTLLELKKTKLVIKHLSNAFEFEELPLTSIKK